MTSSGYCVLAKNTVYSVKFTELWAYALGNIYLGVSFHTSNAVRQGDQD